MMDDKTWFELTAAEREQGSQLTPSERAAIDTLMSALRGIPATLCIDMDDFEYELRVQKRTTRGSAMQVAKLRKKSLFF